MGLPHTPPFRGVTAGGNVMPSQVQRKHEDMVSYVFEIKEINDKPNRTVDDIRKRNDLEDELFEIVKDHPDRFVYIKERNCPRLLERLEELEVKVKPIEQASIKPLPAPRYALLNLKDHWKFLWDGEETISKKRRMEIHSLLHAISQAGIHQY
jgi:hypothetical protein